MSGFAYDLHRFAYQVAASSENLDLASLSQQNQLIHAPQRPGFSDPQPKDGCAERWLLGGGLPEGHCLDLDAFRKL